jgi:lysophospholipase L1-like esterase
MSGYNTRWFLRYADDDGVWEEPGNVVLVTVFFGANDAALADRDPAKHVPVPEYKDNLRALIKKARVAYPDAGILALSPPPVHEQQRLDFQKQRYGDRATGVPERTREHTQQYASACVDVAREMNVPCVDLFTAMVEKGGVGDDDHDGEGYGRYLSDGLHFNQAGHRFVFEELVGAIERHFPGLAVTPDPVTGQPNNSASTCPDLESSGPYHDEINYKSWETAFDR